VGWYLALALVVEPVLHWVLAELVHWRWQLVRWPPWVEAEVVHWLLLVHWLLALPWVAG
jgi:hypothetical protein